MTRLQKAVKPKDVRESESPGKSFMGPMWEAVNLKHKWSGDARMLKMLEACNVH